MPLTTEGCGLSAWSKLPRRVLGILRVWGLASVVVFDACNVAVTCCDCALGALSELAEGKVVASQQKQAPHLRWSQAPPRPWRRPGSADMYLQHATKNKTKLGLLGTQFTPMSSFCDAHICPPGKDLNKSCWPTLILDQWPLCCNKLFRQKLVAFRI